MEAQQGAPVSRQQLREKFVAPPQQSRLSTRNPYCASKESNFDLVGRQAVSPGSFISDCYLRHGRQKVGPFYIKEKRGETSLEGLPQDSRHSLAKYVPSYTRQPRFPEMATLSNKWLR